MKRVVNTGRLKSEANPRFLDNKIYHLRRDDHTLGSCVPGATGNSAPSPLLGVTTEMDAAVAHSRWRLATRSVSTTSILSKSGEIGPDIRDTGAKVSRPLDDLLRDSADTFQQTGDCGE